MNFKGTSATKAHRQLKQAGNRRQTDDRQTDGVPREPNDVATLRPGSRPKKFTTQRLGTEVLNEGVQAIQTTRRNQLHEHEHEHVYSTTTNLVVDGDLDLPLLHGLDDQLLDFLERKTHAREVCLQQDTKTTSTCARERET